MTVPLTNKPLPSKAPATAETTAVKKRRRRAPAGGAADDCFTCSKRNVKCDRRRPYCSQCLELGNECSGYKTQLTWGVGVASRGKLRGLSLPIAKAPPVSSQTSKSASARARASSSANNSHWHEQESFRRDSRGDGDYTVPEHHLGSSVPTTPYPGYDFSRMAPEEAHASLSQPNWSHFSTSLPAESLRLGRMGLHVGHPGDNLSSSIDSLSDVDYMSPMSHTFSREDIPFMHSPTVIYESFTGHNSPAIQTPISTALLSDQPTVPTSCPSLLYPSSEHGSSLPSQAEPFESHLGGNSLHDGDHAENLILGTPDLDTYSTSAQSNGHFWGSCLDDDASSHDLPERSPAAWPSLLDPPSVHMDNDLIAKMPFFLDYYENTMCPSMVFIDGPNNPFRNNIMQLASGSRSLQHAICALSACNLRMKRKLSLGQHTRNPSELSELLSDSRTDDHALTEEYQHRNLAVHLLNEQLNDTTKSKHDSVLATILILCHYRMAESGIAKFHTQFAGVKKILAMRRSSTFPPSRDSAWMESLFTYFDAISASINDREAQLDTNFYGVMPDAQLLPPGAENLVGCDRDLFKTIIKLGRLNLLSQHRPVQNALGATLSHGTQVRSQSPLTSPLGHAYRTHLGGDSYGFPTMEDEDPLSVAPGFDSQRNTFWREWKEARSALQAWDFEPQRFLSSLPASSPQPTSAQVRDLGSLSEAFRYAALLYTERLANPASPSEHNNFRNLVSQIVYYANSLETGSAAEKFLLWPLFVAGSECVNELQQSIVRSKCRSIMSRSGYMNNLSALDVLERLWAGEIKSEADERPRTAVVVVAGRGSGGAGSPSGSSRGAGSSKPGRGPFNWTGCIGGPGVEVEWIMF
ncbi:uncharacterized protein E0L32_008644 [Thyridium curvatum]|uniref:Zn(2)-C6 fungal-type domain-containing protein n=1 Tax=Thyridium curvatum TaxID=1093900 RepID=A0A507AJE7_9PEZI|nr:uncharacterized protein E0L32_008644 [Thyridium curvatum]TPX10425.1 hypothetical protein E0L32_008644 [Thyridium curvatum]